MKNIEKFMEFFFSLCALIIAKIVAELFFEGSFTILLIVYVIMALIGLWISDIVLKKNKKNRSVWRMVLAVIFSWIFVFSIYGICWALGVLDGTILEVCITVILGALFVFSMGAIVRNAGLRRDRKGNT